jgi:hypothetical protein
MVTSFLLLLLGLLCIALYLWQKPANKTDTDELPPPEHIRGLFTETATKPAAPATGQNLAIPRSEQSTKNTHKELAEALIGSFRNTADRDSTVELLHTAALSDDAETYGRALEAAMQAWRERKLGDLSATELQALFMSEFWVLSSGTRTSGAGFVLKRTLSSVQRELEGTTNNKPTVN